MIKAKITNKKTYILCIIAIIIVMIPNLIAIRFAIFTPDDFGFSLAQEYAGNLLSIMLGRAFNPMVGLNYSVLRCELVVFYLLFVISLLLYSFLLISNIGVEQEKACIISTLMVCSFLFFGEYYELFFWWIGAVFYEIPAAIILLFLSISLVADGRKMKILKIVSLSMALFVILLNVNPGTYSSFLANHDGEMSLFEGVFATVFVFENSCKNYLKSTGFILILMIIFCLGMSADNRLAIVKNLRNRIWHIFIPVVCLFPMIYGREIFTLDRLPNRGEAIIDLSVVWGFSIIALLLGAYVGEKSYGSLEKMKKILLCVCLVVFAINLRYSSDFEISKNVINRQLQTYSETWSSIYYSCDNSQEADLVIETSVPDRVEGCSHAKLRSKTTSEKNENVARFFGLNTVSLNNTYEK